VKAVVLVGGEGTRLRPLTETIPKPLIPLVDRPFLEHVLDHLGAYGVEQALLSSPYLEEAFAPLVGARRAPPRPVWITEPEPLGTGGAVANAARGLEETILVLNGDILTDLDLAALVAHHRDAGGIATLTLAPVEDARPYGLVTVDEHGRVLEFREKPADPVAGLVNVGTYVLEPEALLGIAMDRPVSIEREVFPSLISSGRPVTAFVSHAYWMDLGTPEKYLQATFDALEGRIGGLDYAAPYVDPTAQVSLRARLGRWVVAGPGSVLEDDAEVEDSVVLDRAKIEPGAKVRGSIIGPRARVERGAVLSGAVLAERAVARAGVVRDGARVGAGRVLTG